MPKCDIFRSINLASRDKLHIPVEDKKKKAVCLSLKQNVIVYQQTRCYLLLVLPRWANAHRAAGYGSDKRLDKRLFTQFRLTLPSSCLSNRLTYMKSCLISLQIYSEEQNVLS